MLMRLLANAWNGVRDVNRRYSEPQIKMTPLVAFSLGLLRFYLLFLIALLVWKFFSVLHK